METQRIATMVYQLRKSRADLLLEASALEAQLRQLLAIPGSEPLTVDLDEQAAIANASGLYLALQANKSAAPDTLPEMELLSHQPQA